MKKKTIAERMGFKGRKDEGGNENPPFYARHYKGGGLKGHQLVTPKHVFSLTKNSSWSNGPKHGWKIEHKKRKDTNL